MTYGCIESSNSVKLNSIAEPVVFVLATSVLMDSYDLDMLTRKQPPKNLDLSKELMFSPVA